MCVSDVSPSCRFMNIFILTWALPVAGRLCALLMIHMRVLDYMNDDEL